MARFLKSRLKAKGAAPGSFIFLGKQKVDNPRIRLFSYNADSHVEKEFKNIHDAISKINGNHINWLNIDGLHDIKPIEEIGKKFNVSSLALENVLNTDIRSKHFEDKNSITVVSKVVYFNTEINKISVEQISFILFENLIISLQEKPGDYFEPVRNRIRENIGKIRVQPTDYLLYSLLDCIIDYNFIIIEQIGEKIEQIDKKIINFDKTVNAEIYHYKTELSYFRKTIRPLKEMMTRLLRVNSNLIHNETMVYFHELNDLIEQSIEAVDTYYSLVTDQLNHYNTNISNQANSVMKFLTIFASIFIPLTFIAGIYGTNFDNIPELHLKNGYFAMWGVMIAVSVTMLLYFKKNKWL